MTRQKVVNLDLINMAQATVKGRAAGAGTGVPQDLTAAQVAAILAGLFGDVVGPASAINGHLAVFDTTTGKLIKDGGAIPAAQVNSDWSAGSGVAQILNKPTIPAALPANSAGILTNDGTGVITWENDMKVDAKYQANNLDDYTTTNVTYVGEEDTAGVWKMVKIDETGTSPVFTYASVTNNPSLTTYALAWAARVIATYNLYSIAF